MGSKSFDLLHSTRPLTLEAVIQRSAFHLPRDECCKAPLSYLLPWESTSVAAGARNHLPANRSLAFRFEVNV
jgi:hypothetical protein